MSDARKNKLSWFLIATLVFLTAVGFTIIFPVMPFLIQEELSNPTQLALWVGILETIAFACAFIAAPVLGALSDRWGRKPILVISTLGTALSFFLFGIGGSLLMLIIARVIDGLTAGDQPVMFAYLADITPEKDRAKRYGFLGALSGIGMLVGPAIGGLLATISLSAPAFATAGIALLIALISLFFLPESLPKNKRVAKLKLEESHPIGAIKNAFARKPLRPLLICIALIGIPFAFFTSNISVLALDTVNWGPTQLGLLLSAVGVLDILVQGVLLGLLLKRLGERGVIIAGIITQAIGIGLLILAASIFPAAWILAAGSLIMATGEGGMSATLQGLISNSVGENEQGKIAGAVSSLSTGVQMLGPLLAGVLYAAIAPAAPYALGFVLICIAGYQFIAGNKRAPTVLPSK